MKRWRSGQYLGLFFGCAVLILCAVAPVAGQERAPDAEALTVQELERQLDADADNADLWLKLGHARLGAEDLKGAEAAFRKALGAKDDRLEAQAYNGLGLVYAARPKELQTAVFYFQKAIRKDPTYVDAHYNKAQTYFSRDWLPQAIRSAEDALAADSTYTPARLLIKNCLAIQAEERRQSEQAYEAYLKSESDNLERWLELSKLALSKGDYQDLLQRLPPVVAAHPEWRELLPLLAQAYWRGNLLVKAWQAFQTYVEGLDAEGRELYTDIRQVASGNVANRYDKTTPEGRAEMAQRFWAERDPDYTTQVNERLLEHYRRVWYARTYFSKRKQPWDRRGEVYIRYGEPDHRSRSSEQSQPPTMAANAVKERFYNLLYSDMWAVFSMGGGSEIRTGQDVSTEEDPFALEENQGTMKGISWFDGVTGGLTGTLVGPVFPIRSYDPDVPGGVYMPIGSSDFSLVKWESWVYADVDGGIVIDFTDEIGRGAFDYAPIPQLDKTPGLRSASTAGTDAIRVLSMLARRSPKVVMQAAAAAMPERYSVPSDYRALDFYFDHAKFRGEDDACRVEVYYGVPMVEMTYYPVDRKTGIRALCRAALAEKRSRAVYRTESQLVHLEEGDRTEGSGFVPHIGTLNVPPGEYTLDVRVENALNGEVGYYRKDVMVEAFPRGPLKLSDIELAWKVSEAGTESDRFTKNGLRVLPMSTRHYQKGQPVYIYYEIYNLARDSFGRTKYTVEYTVRSGKPPGIISRIFKGAKAEDEDQQVGVTQEQLGAEETQVSYVELDLSDALPGMITLRVTVNDLIGAQTATQEAKFWIEEED